MRPALFVVISSLLSCATSSPTPAPTTTHAEEPSVAAAFEPEPTAAPPVQVKAPPPLPDVRAPFREASEAAQRALASKDLDGARQEATRATKLAGTLGATERVKAAELTFKVALAAGAAAEAREAARDWLGACGDEGVEVCRTQALNALVSTARLEPASTKELRDEVAELQKAESCFKTSERAKKPERCFADAERTARAHHDGLLIARALWVRALAAPEPKQPALFASLEQQCDSPAALSVKRRALAHLVAKAKGEKKLDDAARWAIKDAEAYAQSLPESERAWGRPPELDAVCAAFDSSSGPGACRKLEKQLTSRWTFRDFSKDKPREGLSPDQVRAVNEHYAPLLQECLAAQARRLRPPDAVRYEVRWMVFNDGRVGEVHFRDAAMDGSELGGCLRAQFETWRYPRYEGEWQHVEQSFTVTAVERRSER